MTIQEKCEKLNSDIHNRMFLDNYFSAKFGNYEQAFTSIDVIEDCQDAIDEFESIPENEIKNRTTLYIYGVLQSIYCQQDGIFNLYKILVNSEVKGINDFFELYNFNKKIREVRNDIAGHPTNRNYTKEFYFISKGSNTKYKFSYAGYNPDYKSDNVDLKQFINEQNTLINEVFNDLFDSIKQKIQEHKDKFKSRFLHEMISDLNRPIQLISRGIWDVERNSQAETGIKVINEELSKVKDELKARYNKQIPDSIEYILISLDYIIRKFKNWFSKSELLNNKDAEIFFISLKNQIEELEYILKKIDIEYNC